MIITHDDIQDWDPTTHLSQGLSIGAHVCQNDQDVFLTLIGKKLGCSQRQTRGDNTLNTEGGREGEKRGGEQVEREGMKDCTDG